MFRILVIDDDMVDRMSIARALMKYGNELELVEAESAVSGLSLASESQFDCILLDLALPDSTPEITMASLIATDAPVIVLTGSSFDERATELLGVGAQDFLEKGSVSPARLYQTIKSAIERHRLLREHMQAIEELGRLGKVVESLHTEFYAFNTDSFQISYANQGAASASRYSNQELTELSITDLSSDFSRERLDDMLRPLHNGSEHIVRATSLLRRKDNSCYMASLSFQLANSDTPNECIVVIDDISERLESEAKLRQAQKMEAMSQLVGGIAHDFNNLLTSVIGGLSYLKKEALSNRGLIFANLALSSAERGAELVGRLLAIARKQDVRPAIVNVAAAVQSTAAVLQRTIIDSVQVEIEIATDDAMANIDLVSLESALINLAINSQDAMPRGGHVRITVDRAFCDETGAISPTGDRRASLAEGQYVCISVIDNGEGMTESVAERVFEPFYTTKPAGKGTGLGLSMVSGFCEQNRGSATIHSTPDVGTTVRMYIPEAIGLSEVDQDRPSSGVQSFDGRGKCVLVVDDDAQIREIAGIVLKENGFTVFQAESGVQAVSCIETAAVRFDLLLTDVVMAGGVDGSDVAACFREHFGAKPVIYSSGYNDSALVSMTKLPPGSAFLSKPYAPGQLLSLLNQVLSAT